MNLFPEKRCTGCGKTKMLSEFHRRERKKDGRVSRCKSCIKARPNEKEYRRRNDEKKRARYKNDPDYRKMVNDRNSKSREKRERLSPGINARENKAWREGLPDELRKAKQRSNWLSTKYGITLDDYNEMLSASDGTCYCCGKLHAKQDRELSVDHCHVTGEVRGLLCRNCNVGIGLLGDARQGVLAAARYLEVHSGD